MNPLTKTVVVPLHPKTEITMLLCQLQSIVNPGDRIELLIEHRDRMVPWFFAQVALMQTGLDGAVRREEQRTLDMRIDLNDHLEREIAVPARRMFSGMDVHVNVSLYAGSLQRLIDRYLRTGQVTIVVGGPARLPRLSLIFSKVRDRLLRRNTHELPILLVHAEIPGLRG